MIKKLIIRWALRQIAKMFEHASYHTLSQYGIRDILTPDYSKTEIQICIKK